MKVPPGPAYLLRLLPHVLYPAAIVYAIIDLAGRLFSVSVPPWLIVVAIILAKPTLFIANRYYQFFKNERAAAYNGAVLPPPVRESLLSVVGKLTKSMANGYPGE